MTARDEIWEWDLLSLRSFFLLETNQPSSFWLLFLFHSTVCLATSTTQFSSFVFQMWLEGNLFIVCVCGIFDVCTFIFKNSASLLSKLKDEAWINIFRVLKGTFFKRADNVFFDDTLYNKASGEKKWRWSLQFF